MAPVSTPVPDGMLAAQARIAAIRAMVSPGRTGGTSGAAFGAALSAAAAELGGVSAAAVTSGAGTGEQAVALAKQHLGTPYVWGGAAPGGFDCSGLVQHVYAQLGIDLPRVSADQAKAGTPVASLAEAQPGDLVFFDWSSGRAGIDHVGIYAGDGKMVVAPKTGDVVKVQEITSTPAVIRRVAPTSTSAAGFGAAGTGTSYDALFDAAGARHGVSPALLASVAKAESGLNPRAVSRAGAQGLMQLMPGTAKSLGVDAFDPAQAVDGAARLLKSHLDAFGSTELALAAYNAGPGAVKRYGGVPPYSETQTYVRRVLAGVQGGNAWN